MFPLSKTDRPRIVRVQVRRADGTVRWRLVKCPYYERDPQASLFGLQAKLAELTLSGSIIGQSVTVPATITPKARERLTRWPEALEEMIP